MGAATQRCPARSRTEKKDNFMIMELIINYGKCEGDYDEKSPPFNLKRRR
jgi:hypothetical protein